ncbi:salicylate carboxymethyltransferase-like [Vigna radiata var. radiata]|uniref:Salicylate carboxymethyltransferase-like n=1 Tax=Vigna radiata var. radiata TaxID=3916 RepID=A0A1S3VNG2_VIGRR|nr:salicylate carboxymethyltransferase-like [Vigna radiata var. radiata]
MEVTQVLHMNGGTGETSYASNSLVQQKAICLTRVTREEAMSRLYRSMRPKRLAIADLGCSSGPNALLVMSEAIKLVEKLCRELKQESPEYEIYLNDLPGNDFNNIFKSLESFKERLRNEIEDEHGMGSCFFNGVPGSFYGRIFPNKTLHFVHSSYSLMWLSKVPEGVENNKGNIYMSSTSPSNVLKAYYEQYQKDFSLFLKCRGEEMVEGGRMVLTILGRRSHDRSSKECCYIWELLARALNHMVSEGMIKEEQMEGFNIPQYTPSPSEVELEVEKEGSFSITAMEVSVVPWNAYDDSEYGNLSESLRNGGYNVAKCMRAVAEPLLISHFGEAIVEEVFHRYQQILTETMSEEKNHFVNVTISLIRKERSA